MMLPTANKAFDAALASRSAEKQMLRDAPPTELCEKLLHHFSAFQASTFYADLLKKNAMKTNENNESNFGDANCTVLQSES